MSFYCYFYSLYLSFMHLFSYFSRSRNTYQSSAIYMKLSLPLDPVRFLHLFVFGVKQFVSGGGYDGQLVVILHILMAGKIYFSGELLGLFSLKGCFLVIGEWFYFKSWYFGGYISHYRSVCMAASAHEISFLNGVNHTFLGKSVNSFVLVVFHRYNLLILCAEAHR